MSRYPHIDMLLFDQPWLITPRGLQSLVARVEALDGPDLETVATKLGRPLENAGHRAERRGNLAILGIQGPIFRYANLMTECSGATSVEMLAQDFGAALANPAVEQILLRVDSPGGEVAGIHDLAEMIRGAAKPVTAFVDGLGASAAYWLGSAAHKLYGAASSFTGSIGAVATLTDRRGAQEKQGVKTYTIVSSMSPLKVADPSTEEGMQALKSMVDSVGELFVSNVARYRNVSAEHVTSKFGQGFVKMARPALDAGMIDGITTEEALIASLTGSHTTMTAVSAVQEDTMADNTGTATNAVPNNSTSSATSSGTGGIILGSVVGTLLPTEEQTRQAERQRIQAILTLPEAVGREQLAQTLAFEGISAETAQRILAAAPAATVSTSSLDREMARLGNPNVGAATDDADNVQTQVEQILSWVPDHLKVKSAQRSS